MSASSLGLAFFVGVATITGCAANGYAKRINPDTSHVPPAAVMRRADAPLMIVVDKPMTQPVTYRTNSQVGSRVDQTDPTVSDYTPDEWWLAFGMFTEARGEPLKGKVAVGQVVMARVADGQWGDIVGVLDAHKRNARGNIVYQFSGMNPADVNYAKAMKAALNQDPAFTELLPVARKIIKGQYPDYARDADHYHADSVKPSWGKKMKTVTQIGRHIFKRGA